MGFQEDSQLGEVQVRAKHSNHMHCVPLELIAFMHWALMLTPMRVFACMAEMGRGITVRSKEHLATSNSCMICAEPCLGWIQGICLACMCCTKVLASCSFIS